MSVSKSTIGCLLVLGLAASLAGCGKEQPSSAADTAAAPAASTPAVPPHGAETAPHPVPTASSETVDLSGIEKADGGKTIAEVFAEKDQLAGQPVVVRGRIVKTNPGIMGKNWLHVRDGTGAEGTNNLTVTTTDVLPNVGDTVLVAGPLAVDKDFGMGYRYDLIIEDAEVTVESESSY
jgi:hypothetical protein